MIINPGFSYDSIVAITLSDTVNNLVGVRYLQNVGSAGGTITFRQTSAPGDPHATSITACPLYFAQGQIIECGRFFVGANSTSAGVGVSLVGFK